MKIAVTHSNGEIFQHFGRTEEFKVYEVENGTVVSAQIMGSNGAGHGALAGVLAENQVDVLICGGMGNHAQEALAAHGIEIVAGIQGNADEAVAAYLAGDLESSGANCDHHHGEGEGHDCHCGGHDSEDSEGCGCGSDEEGGCNCGSDEDGEGGCNCGSDEEGEGGCCCGGGCGGGEMQFTCEGPNVGKICKVHYRGTFNDGTQFDSSYDRGETLDFTCGVGMMIPGFDAAVAVMEVGQTVDIHLMPEEAYGPKDPNAIMTFPIAQMPGAEALTVGQQVYLSNAMGQPFPVTVVAMENGNITFDANHEMAGKELNFHIELVEVTDTME